MYKLARVFDALWRSTLMMKSYKVADDLFLVWHSVSRASALLEAGVEIPGSPRGGVAFCVGKEVRPLFLEAGKVNVPKDLDGFVWTLESAYKPVLLHDNTPLSILSEICSKPRRPSHPAIDATYAAASLFVVRGELGVCRSLLRATGDVAFLEQFSGLLDSSYDAFSKALAQAAVDPSVRWLRGYSSFR